MLRNILDTGRSKGFTIIEMVVALVILGFGISALLGSMSDSLNRQTRLEGESAAVAVADSLLARLGADLPVIDGYRSGRTSAIDWSIELSPYPSAGQNPPTGLALEKITLTLSWSAGGRRQVALWQTLRAPAPSGKTP